MLVLVATASACAPMMASLRRDLDDGEPFSPPTTGGTWSERGLLSADGSENAPYAERYDAVGHSERSPASASYGGAQGRGSWVTPDQSDANRRDLYRDGGRPQEGEEEGSGFGVASASTTPNMAPSTKRLYKGGGRATKADFVDDGQNDSSLWASDGQTNYYFTKNKIRGVGDLVTISAEDAFVKDTVAEITRTLSANDREDELNLAQMRLTAKAFGQEDPTAPKGAKDSINSSASAPSRAPAAKKTDEEPVIPTASYADIDVGKSVEFKAGDPIMSEIVERYPNGNYKVRGTKRIRYRNSSRLVSVVGVVRGADISEDDVINSGKMYEYRLEALR